MTTTQSKVAKTELSSTSILLFIPNIIGFARIVSALLGFYLSQNGSPWWCIVLGSISVVLDAFDGWTARLYDQSTTFGAILDMVTDRCFSTLLCMQLAVIKPSLLFPAQIMVAIDLGSHWMAQMEAAKGQRSHKALPEDVNILLRVYYTSRIVLGGLCVCYDGCLMALYGWIRGIAWMKPLALIQLPLMCYKVLLSVLQLKMASSSVITRDVEEVKERRKIE
eukprot:gnl/Dysnectes_brevis/784_a864_4511.p1 GENE.gnl/Dysnectes_brevis/784_a864_4511~~gnl/Dysnectes_brevis/784_a864_4511.p1  ORF type:complete len:222 (-),score=26.92 gnl/Dysnectes_brevis/784_a864_4511:113-778(-)